jgi:hypothetical protein
MTKANFSNVNKCTYAPFSLLVIHELHALSPNKNRATAVLNGTDMKPELIYDLNTSVLPMKQRLVQY